MPQDAQIQFTPGTLPEGFCPGSEQERYNRYVLELSGFLPGNFSSFNFGPDQPTVDNQDKPWIKTDAAGALVGVFTFSNGAWIRPHEIPAGPNGLRVLWVGTTTELLTYDGGSAGAITATTGPFWEVDALFTDKIPVGAGANAAVATDAAQLQSGASAADEVRGAYFVKRSARTHRTS